MTEPSEQTPKVEVAKPQSLLGGTIEALKSKNIPELAVGLTALNTQLTGLARGDFATPDRILPRINNFYHQIDQGKPNPAEIVYLGDSGLSRLVLYSKSGEFGIRLDDRNSQDKPKAKWAELQKQYEELDGNK